jgi:hypothetical protein
MNTDMNKQTAVKWLYDYLLQMNETREWRSKDLHIDKFHEAFKEAMQIESEQLADSYKQGVYSEFKGIGFKGFKDYYNETYGGDK